MAPPAHPPLLGSLNIRVPVQFLHWLQDQATVDDTSVAAIVRNCVAAAIVRNGDAERYGIEVVDEIAEQLGEPVVATPRPARKRRSK